MEALGRMVNFAATADGVWVSLRDAAGITFLCSGADTYTLQSATTAAGAGAANLAIVDHFYSVAAGAGATAWARTNQAVGAAVVLAGGVAVIEVDSKALPAGHDYIRCSSAAAGLVTAVTHDLAVQRDPRNLAPIGV